MDVDQERDAIANGIRRVEDLMTRRVKGLTEEEFRSALAAGLKQRVRAALAEPAEETTVAEFHRRMNEIAREKP